MVVRLNQEIVLVYHQNPVCVQELNAAHQMQFFAIIVMLNHRALGVDAVGVECFVGELVQDLLLYILVAAVN